MRIIRPEEFPTPWLRLLPTQKRAAGNPGTRIKYEYKDIVTAFDIETTRIVELEQTVMYIWQWCFGDQFVVIGRTWDEFLDFMEVIQSALREGERLYCAVHNLSYEFHFLRGIHEFAAKDVFAIKSRKVLSAMWGQVEFRCSYIQTNMSLAEFTDKMHVQHQKLSGEEFDYNKIRYPWTPMTDRELEYCVNDVVGLVEALTVEMQHDGDSLYTLPPTSTGYVRRDAKAAMREVSWYYVHNQLPTLEIFAMLREAFRGGDVHANRFFAGQIVKNVHSADRSSSYPDIVCNDPFPVSEFFVEPEVLEMEDVIKLIETRGRAVIMRVAITDIQLLDPYFPAPYLSRDKCREIIGGDYDNGRILKADYLETTLTDIDLKILLREYKWTDIVFMQVAHARYGQLPRSLINCAIEYYKAKTELKGVPEQDIFYTKSKNKLNSIYGMMAQNPCRRRLVYTQTGVIDKWGLVDYYPEDHTKTDQEILDDANRKAFLCYQWGCWVTAWARYRLREGIWTVIDQGGEWLYGDTDSVKYLGEIDWTAYNAERIRASKASGAWADDPAGERHYMGVYEQEHDMYAFRTWGAKKYAYTTAPSKKWLTRHPDSTEELVCTTAGVAKTLGADELLAAGGLKAYKPGFVFRAAGGLEAVYNDEIDEVVKIDGHELRITPNVTLRPSTYEMGISWDYERLLRRYKTSIDI